MRNHQKGFILIDSLVGMVVLSMALLGLAAIFMQSTKGTVATDNQNKAAYIANEQLSRLKVHDGQKQDRNSTVWATTKTVSQSNGTSNGMTFTVITEVVPAEDVPADLHADTIPVRATVNWSEPTGTKQLEFITYYYYGERK
ncbi:hypothetical protein [Pelosinus sp. sgz500959]|uniref:type IV pilus modification PilV family protein n=1 Tax=Pelosinus sp. sgz500959 TaxID=3242472 RepID=UPI00366F1D5E